MPKPISVADAASVRVAIVTLDSHLSSAAARAQQALRSEIPGLTISVHAAAEWGEDAAALEHCKADIARADLVIATMLFLQDHIRLVAPALQARREQCDAMVACMSAGEVMKLTRMGRFSMDNEAKGPMALLKRLRGKKEGAGAQQMKMLRRAPQVLRFIPGPAQDVRAYFLTLQYWLGGSEENMANMVRYLVDRYADGPRRHLRGTLKAARRATSPKSASTIRGSRAASPRKPRRCPGPRNRRAARSAWYCCVRIRSPTTPATTMA